MTSDTQPTRPPLFVSCRLPWLLAGALLIVYLFTLNHWVMPAAATLLPVSQVSGWNWRPEIFAPVTHLVTLPFRALPALWIPLALNLFSAVCGALILALLARSVALLPRDRTNEQRERETSPLKVLTIPAAWLPPTLAVLVCGLQLSFWENCIQWQKSTLATGAEMLDLLMFAYLVRCLLEFRIDRRDAWLNKFALVCGLALADNLGMLGFLPAFLGAVVWIRGFSFFNVRFLIRSAALFLAGFLLILLLPFLATRATLGHQDFWPALKLVLGTYKGALAFPRSLAALLCLASVLPVFVMGFRWASYFGDSSQLGVFVARAMFHLVHGLFLLACLWVAFDSPVSPRHLSEGLNYRLPFLPLYFLAALSIGYFSGYFLLVFGTKLARGRERVHPAVAFGRRCLVWCVWAILPAAPLLLLYKNLPVIQRAGKNALQEYAALLERTLPPPNSLILSDDPWRLLTLKTTLVRAGRQNDYALVDTASLNESADYFHFLDRQHPSFQLSRAITNSAAELTSPLVLIRLLDNLSASHGIYYLHPSFGFYFEEFYTVPEGLFYQMRPYERGTIPVPPLSPAAIEANQTFWQNVAGEQLKKVAEQIKPPDRDHPGNVLDWLLMHAHAGLEPDLPAVVAGLYYSRSLDYWGVELQRNGRLPEAAKCFEQAQLLNPENVPARENLQFNKDLRAHKKAEIKTPKVLLDKWGKFRTWDAIITEDGPFDEPNFCFQLGETYLTYGSLRQSIQQLQRATALAPDYFDAHLQLANIYLSPLVQDASNALAEAVQAVRINPTNATALLIKGRACFQLQDYSNALAAAEQALVVTPKDPNALFLKGGSLIPLKAFDRAIAALSELLTLQATNYAVQFNRAIAYLQQGNLPAASNDYSTVVKADATFYPAYFGLGQVADRNHNDAEALRNYKLYLANAPTNTAEFTNSAEFKQVTDRVKELSGQR